MFERYTEKARRIIFFARYEASQSGSHYIEPEHLLLGLFREDKGLSTKFIGTFNELDSIRRQIENATTRREKVSTSVDLPLSKASKSVLARAENERVGLGTVHLGTEHILLGLLKEESLAAQVLNERGLSAEWLRRQIENAVALGPTQIGKPTACKDCRHLIVDGAPDELRSNLFCAASPIKPTFDCYTGEFLHGPGDRPSDRYKPCMLVNFGECRLFEPKQESVEQLPRS
jgi:hypothetical protein